MNHLLFILSFLTVCLQPLGAAPQEGTLITTQDYCSFLNDSTPEEAFFYLEPKRAEVLFQKEEPSQTTFLYTSVEGKEEQPISYLSYADAAAYKAWHNTRGNRESFLFLFPSQEPHGVIDRELLSNKLSFLLGNKSSTPSMISSSKAITLKKVAAAITLITATSLLEERPHSVEDPLTIDSETDSSTSLVSLEEEPEILQEVDLLSPNLIKKAETIPSQGISSLFEERNITPTPKGTSSNAYNPDEDPQREMASKLADIYYSYSHQLGYQGIQEATLFRDASFSLFDAIRQAEKAKTNSPLETWYQQHKPLNDKLTTLIQQHPLEKTKGRPFPPNKRKNTSSEPASSQNKKPKKETSKRVQNLKASSFKKSVPEIVSEDLLYLKETLFSRAVHHKITAQDAPSWIHFLNLKKESLTLFKPLNVSQKKYLEPAITSLDAAISHLKQPFPSEETLALHLWLAGTFPLFVLFEKDKNSSSYAQEMRTCTLHNITSALIKAVDLQQRSPQSSSIIWYVKSASLSEKLLTQIHAIAYKNRPNAEEEAIIIDLNNYNYSVYSFAETLKNSEAARFKESLRGKSIQEQTLFNDQNPSLPTTDPLLLDLHEELEAFFKERPPAPSVEKSKNTSDPS